MQGKYRWPDGVRCVVTLTVDFDGPSHETGRQLAPLGVNSHGRYAGRRGVYRYLDLFEKHGIPSTFYVPGYDAECYPQVVKDIHDRGFEVGAHGYLHESWDVGDDEEMLLRKSLRHCVEMNTQIERQTANRRQRIAGIQFAVDQQDANSVHNLAVHGNRRFEIDTQDHDCTLYIYSIQ